MTTTTGKLIGMIKLVLLISDVLTLAACGPCREKIQKIRFWYGRGLLRCVRTVSLFWQRCRFGARL